MAEYLWFMSLRTGKTGKYPAHYASDPSFVEVDSEEAPCIDCIGDYADSGTEEVVEDEDALIAAMYEDDEFDPIYTKDA